MKPILFEGTETTFTSNGLGRIDAQSCTVTEERNGQYELEMVMSIDDPHYADVQEGRLLLVRHDDTLDKQPFEIYQISRPINGQVTVYAHHISYRTEKIVVMPFATQSGIVAAMAAMEANAIGGSTFTLWTDKSTATDFSHTEPKSMRTMLGGSSGSLLDVFGGGDYEWDKFTIKLHAHRGRNTGVVLKYGKDITDLKKTGDTSNLWTGVAPFWKGNDDSNDETIVTLTEKVLYSSARSSFDYDMVVPLNLSSKFETEPTEAQLRAAAQTYISNNAKSGVPTSVDVSFVALWQTDEYADVAALQRLSLCDTVTIQYTKLGVSETAKIIKTVYNVLLERYDSMTIGESRTNLSTTLTGGLRDEVDNLKTTTNNRITQTASILQSGIDYATSLITTGEGHVVLVRDANENVSEILVMNTDDPATATNVLRINVNGIGFSSTGVAGPYTSAWTLDGQFVADFITAGTLSANRIAGGTLTDLTGNNTWNLQTGAMNFQSLSWNSTNSSMTSAGVLSCTGATMTGTFTATGTEDGYATTATIENGTFSFEGTKNNTTLAFDITLGDDANGNKSILMGASQGSHLLLRSYNSSYNTTVWLDPAQIVLDARYGSSGNIRLWADNLIELNSDTISLSSNDIQVNGANGYTGSFWSIEQSMSGNHYFSFVNGILVGLT